MVNSVNPYSRAMENLSNGFSLTKNIGILNRIKYVALGALELIPGVNYFVLSYDPLPLQVASRDTRIPVALNTFNPNSITADVTNKSFIGSFFIFNALKNERQIRLSNGELYKLELECNWQANQIVELHSSESNGKYLLVNKDLNEKLHTIQEMPQRETPLYDSLLHVKPTRRPVKFKFNIPPRNFTPPPVSQMYL